MGILMLVLDLLPLILKLKSVFRCLVDAFTLTLEFTFSDTGTLKLLLKDG